MVLQPLLLSVLLLGQCAPTATSALTDIRDAMEAQPFSFITQPYSSFRDDADWKPNLEAGAFRTQAVTHIATLERFTKPDALKQIPVGPNGIIEDKDALEELGTLKAAVSFLWTAERFEGQDELRKQYGLAYLLLQERVQDKPKEYEKLAQVPIAGMLGLWRFALDSLAPAARSEHYPGHAAARQVFDTAKATEAYHVSQSQTSVGQGYNCLRGHRSWVVIPEIGTTAQVYPRRRTKGVQ